MMRICCVIQYDGSKFYGFQKQPNLVTVQGTIEQALKKIFKADISIHASGRTDAGVHAMAQVFHFDAPFEIPLENLHRALGHYLPPSIYLKSSDSVADDFNSRFDALAKEYRYKIINQREQPYNPMQYDYVTYINHEVDHQAILAVLPLFLGEHDFASFASLRRSKHLTTTRTIYQLDYFFDDAGNYEVRICGNGFLRYMVRTIVGTLLNVGTGRFSYEDVKRLFNEPDRQRAGKSAEPNGLYMWQVWYDEAEFQKKLNE